jgi:antitoxin component YwqK of YwqJK toxin-antitoxin module
LQNLSASNAQPISLKQKRDDATEKNSLSENKKPRLELEITINHRHEAIETLINRSVLKCIYRPGETTYTLSDHSVLKVLHKNGKKEGEATRTFIDGSVLKVPYKDDKPDGELTHTYSDGFVRKWTYQNGIKQNEAPIPYIPLGVEEFDDESKFQDYKKKTTEFSGTFF